MNGGDDSAAEGAGIVREIFEVSYEPNPSWKWSPNVGQETWEFLSHLRLPAEDTSGRDRLRDEAISTLARCHSPQESDGNETGLVIGYVQSGKTTSFTTVAALARDNGYRLLIVCTGVTVPLFKQSSERLQRDLRLNERADRQWMFMENPRASAEDQQKIEIALTTGGTVLITVMKNGRHLDNLSNLLGRRSFGGIPALIVDDEADQASLNNFVQRGAESATYRRILGLRDLLPHHTFLQYTATPQALLLINLIDILSPSFAHVLTPGPMYTGGQHFFEGPDMPLIREIPPADIASNANVLSGPPESLLGAMRTFWVGVGAGLVLDEGVGSNRSMMIHPSARTIPHADYHQWASEIQRLWLRFLQQGSGDPDYEELIADFRVAYDELLQTQPDIPEFDEIVPRLQQAVGATIVTQVNRARGPTPQVDYRQIYAHIVVGGEVLNRGVTIEGLIVTYMPRGRGTGQADTIQQRARWFGYRADYLGYCRVHLSQDMIAAYRAYVEHEADLRRQLMEHRDSGESLRDWRRAFLLDPSLRATRASVLDIQPLRGNYSDSWYHMSAPHEPRDATAGNRSIISEFLSGLGDVFAPNEGHIRRTQPQIHLVAEGVSLQRAYADVLAQVRVAGNSARFYGLLLQVERYLEDHPDAFCTIYQMSRGSVRARRVDAQSGEIVNLFQGENYDNNITRGELLYPGDEEIHSPGNLTIQIHTLRITREAEVIADDVPTLAVWVPRSMANPWASQPNS